MAKSDWMKKVLKHTEDKVNSMALAYACPDCGKKFKVVHGKDSMKDNISCPGCGKLFKVEKAKFS